MHASYLLWSHKPWAYDSKNKWGTRAETLKEGQRGVTMLFQRPQNRHSSSNLRACRHQSDRLSLHIIWHADYLVAPTPAWLDALTFFLLHTWHLFVDDEFNFQSRNMLLHCQLMPWIATAIMTFCQLSTGALISVAFPQDGSDINTIYNNSNNGTQVTIQFNFNITTMIATSFMPSGPLNTPTQKLEVMMLAHEVGLISMIRKSTLDGAYSVCQCSAVDVTVHTTSSDDADWQVSMSYNLSSCVLIGSNQST